MFVTLCDDRSKDGKELWLGPGPGAESKRVRCESDTASQQVSLSLDSCVAADAGNYQLVAANRKGSTKSSARLEIHGV